MFTAIACVCVLLVDTAISVMAADVNADRLQLALRMKADVIVNTLTDDLSQFVLRETNGEGVSRILEATGADHVISGMFSLLRKGGYVTMVGLPKTSLRVENAAHNIVFKSLTLSSVHGRRIFHTWKECEQLIADGLVDVEPIVSHRLPMSRFSEAFSALLNGKACKIILYPHH